MPNGREWQLTKRRRAALYCINARGGGAYVLYLRRIVWQRAWPHRSRGTRTSTRALRQPNYHASSPAWQRRHIYDMPIWRYIIIAALAPYLHRKAWHVTYRGIGVRWHAAAWRCISCGRRGVTPTWRIMILSLSCSGGTRDKSWRAARHRLSMTAWLARRRISVALFASRLSLSSLAHIMQRLRAACNHLLP